MGRADGNIDRFAGVDIDLFSIESHFRCAFDDEPVLSSLRVFLVAESLSRENFNPFDLEISIFLKDCVSSPWPTIKLPHHVVPPRMVELRFQTSHCPLRPSC